MSATINSYLSNNLIRIFTAITQSIGGAPIDPTAISLKITAPNGVITDLSATIVKDSVGNYHADYLPTQYGVHVFEWTGTGTATVFDKQRFMITDTPF